MDEEWGKESGEEKGPPKNGAGGGYVLERCVCVCLCVCWEGRGVREEKRKSSGDVSSLEVALSFLVDL